MLAPPRNVTTWRLHIPVSVNTALTPSRCMQVLRSGTFAWLTAVAAELYFFYFFFLSFVPFFLSFFFPSWCPHSPVSVNTALTPPRYMQVLDSGTFAWFTAVAAELLSFFLFSFLSFFLFFFSSWPQHPPGLCQYRAQSTDVHASPR